MGSTESHGELTWEEHVDREGTRAPGFRTGRGEASRGDGEDEAEE